MCPNTIPTRLVVGSRGQVSVTLSTTARFRSGPGIDNSVIHELQGGTEFTVINGPACSRYTWWQLELSDGTVGWAAEGLDGTYFLEPIVTDDSATLNSDSAGKVRWVLKDEETGQILASEDSALTKEDILVEERIFWKTNQPFYLKRIELYGGFFLGISIFNIENLEESGIGLWLENRELDTFSWDWFQFEKDGIATKIQGTGQIAYKLENVNSYTHISHTIFLTDTVLRANPPPHLNLSRTPRWTLTVFSGSYINWIDGKAS